MPPYGTLSGVQLATAVKIAGADPVSGVGSYFAEVTNDGKLTTSTDVAPLLSAVQAVVALDDTSWTPLPATALASRKTMAVQNQSGPGSMVILNFTGIGVDGWRVPNNSSKVLSVGDSIIVYGRMISGSGSVLVEELA
jgi:hypothetical protein